MIGAYVVLLMVGATAAKPENHLTPPPPYVQYRELFDTAKYYIQSNLPLKHQDIHKPEERQHLGFSVLVGVLGALVSDETKDPLLVVQESIPAALRHYGAIAAYAQTTLSELELKTEVIRKVIDNECGSKSVEECNRIVQTNVNEDPDIYLDSADLLLRLGKVSNIIVENADKVSELTKDHGEIAFLLRHVKTNHVQGLIHGLRKVKETSDYLRSRQSDN